MKKSIFRVAILLAALTLLLTSCALPALEHRNNGTFYNKKNDVSYLPAPATYKARTLVSGDKIARIPYKEMDDTVLYAIENADTAKYLTDESYQLYYSSTLTLPEVWEMQVDKINIVSTGSISYSTASITEAQDISEIIAAYQNGVHFSKDEIDVAMIPTRYDLEFSSELYPAFYYTLTYWQFATDVLVYELVTDPNDTTPTYEGVKVTYEDYEGESYAVYHFGKRFLYNRTTGECYPLGNTVAKYLE